MGKVIGVGNTEDDRFALWHSMLQLKDCLEDSNKRKTLRAAEKEKRIYQEYLNEYVK